MRWSNDRQIPGVVRIRRRALFRAPALLDWAEIRAIAERCRECRQLERRRYVGNRTQARADRGRRPRNDRIDCPRCGTSIVPRVVTDRGRLTRTVCSFCGTTVKRFRSWLPVLVAILLLIVVSAVVLQVLARR